jgi:hypothetical protein
MHVPYCNLWRVQPHNTRIFPLYLTNGMIFEEEEDEEEERKEKSY